MRYAMSILADEQRAYLAARRRAGAVRVLGRVIGVLGFGLVLSILALLLERL